MNLAVMHRIPSPRPWMAGLACWVSVVVSMACGSVAFGDGGLLATSGVMGLASSLGSMSDAEIQAIDARSRSESFAAQSVAIESQVLPRPVPARGVLARPGQPRVQREESPVPAPTTFRPARPRSAAEMHSTTEPGIQAAPVQQSPSRPSVTSPARLDGPRPEATRPVTGDRPPMPFSRLLSQVQF